MHLVTWLIRLKLDFGPKYTTWLLITNLISCYAKICIINKDSMHREANELCWLKHERMQAWTTKYLPLTYISYVQWYYIQFAKIMWGREKSIVWVLITTDISVKISTICQRRASWRASESVEELWRERRRETNIVERGHTTPTSCVARVLHIEKVCGISPRGKGARPTRPHR